MNARSKHISLGIGAAAWLAAFFLLARPPQLRAAEAMSCAGVRLPANERAFGVDLVLNGMGIRRVSFMNIQAYVAGLYLERRTKNPADVWPRERTKLMVTTFLRDAEKSRMIEMVRGAIAQQPESIKTVAQKHLPELERRLPDPRKGTRMVFAYGQGRLELRLDGKLAGTWNEPAFAEALFRVWLGPKPSDPKLKSGLLGGECD